MAEPLSYLSSGNQGGNPNENTPSTVVLIESMVEEQVVLLAEELLGVLMRRAASQDSEVPFRPP